MRTRWFDKFAWSKFERRVAIALSIFPPKTGYTRASRSMRLRNPVFAFGA